MIGIDYQPTSATTTTGALDRAPSVDRFGIVSSSGESTNTVSVISVRGRSARAGQVAKFFEQAVIENGDLLRRLAD